MTISASRLGASPLTIDWTHLERAAPARKFKPDFQSYHDAWNALKARFAAGEVGFYDVPAGPQGDKTGALEESQRLAREILASGQITDCLFLGIGGSSLGPLSLLEALPERRGNRLRFHFCENPDALDWKATLSDLRPTSTLVCAVTKSGTTFETLAQTLLALEWLGPSLWKSNVVVITDPTKGDLGAFARTQGLRTLPIAPSIGGRFSIFTPVGFFPMALAGLKPEEFLAGARLVRDFFEKTSVDPAHMEKNPLFRLADELIRHYPARPIHVCMPYSNRLKLLGAWFVQLWGESLGKDGKGFTPLAAVGATDQHSILQLLRDGPDDKVTLFLKIDDLGDEVKIPSPPGTPALAAFRLLQGHSLQELLTVEYRAIAQVLAKRGRPNLTISLDRLDEKAMGSLYFAFCTLTAFTGTLWGVNPFDQPGVEEGKVYIKEALERPSSEA